MLKRLAPLLDTSALTVTGQTLAEVLASTSVRGDSEIIRPLNNPISAGPAIAILKGTLAPESAVVKLGIRDGSRPEFFDGRAVVYKHRQCHGRYRRRQTAEGNGTGSARPGPQGWAGDGGGASLVLFAIDAAGFARDVAFVTDGQLSGLCLKGLTVAEVAPEGATGGPIGKVRNGDRIVIDIAARRLDLDVPAAELAARPLPAAGFPVDATGYRVSTGATCSRWRPVQY